MLFHYFHLKKLTLQLQAPLRNPVSSMFIFMLVTSAWIYSFTSIFIIKILLCILHCLFYRKDSYCLFHLKMGKERTNNLLDTDWRRS